LPREVNAEKTQIAAQGFGALRGLLRENDREAGARLKRIDAIIGKLNVLDSETTEDDRGILVTFAKDGMPKSADSILLYIESLNGEEAIHNAINDMYFIFRRIRAGSAQFRIEITAQAAELLSKQWVLTSDAKFHLACMLDEGSTEEGISAGLRELREKLIRDN
jgi:hypothetical protein